MAEPTPSNTDLRLSENGKLEHLNKNEDVSTDFTPSFPTEFPYEFDSLDSSSPGDSTESETSDDEEDFLAGLTRRLALSTQKLVTVPISTHDKNEEKNQGMTSSPQSTLAGAWGSSVSSPNGPSRVPSPPTTAFGEIDTTWDLIHAAAGQVGRLKMNSEGPFFNQWFSKGHPNQYFRDEEMDRRIVWDRQHHPHHYQHHFHIQSRPPLFLGGKSMPFRRFAQLQHPHYQAPMLHQSAAGKQKCAGTGVFLPRPYNPSKTSDSAIGTRNGFYTQKERRLRADCHLPQEWKY